MIVAVGASATLAVEGTGGPAAPGVGGVGGAGMRVPTGAAEASAVPFAGFAEGMVCTSEPVAAGDGNTALEGGPEVADAVAASATFGVAEEIAIGAAVLVGTRIDFVDVGCAVVAVA